MPEGQVDAQPQSQTNVDGQAAAETPTATQDRAQEFLSKTGFKSLDDVAKTLKEQHATITRLSQEKKQIEQMLKTQYGRPATAAETKPSSGIDFFDDPERAVQTIAEQIAERRVSEMIQQLEAKQVIEKVRQENPKRFDALRPLTVQIYSEKPYLNDMGEEGLRQALNEAEERRKQYLVQLKAELFADENQSSTESPDNVREKMKAELLADIQKAQAATIPQGGVARPIPDDIRQKIKEAQSKGDVDTLLDLKFSSIKP